MPKLVNKKRGEVEVTLGKKTLHIVPSLLNISAWEDATGKHWLSEANKLVTTFASPNPSKLFETVRAKDMMYFFQLCSTEEELTLEDVGELIQEEGLVECASIYVGCLIAAIAPNGTKETKGGIPKAKKQTRRKTTTRKKKA